MSNLRFLGDPRLEPGDVLQVTDRDGAVYAVPCMTLRHEFDGGLVTEITAVGKSESAGSLDAVGPVTKAIERSAHELRTSLIKYQDRIEAKVEDLEGSQAIFEIQLGGITQQVQGLDGQMSSITQTVDSITQRVQGLDGQMSSITQTVGGITQRVQGLDGKYAEVRLTLDGLTVTGPDGATYIRDSSIRTGSITADKLNIRGSISFADLEQDVVEEITSGIAEKEAKTLINSTLVSSPNIAGANYWNLEQTAKMEMKYNPYSGMGYLALYSDGYSTTDEFLAMGLLNNAGPVFLINPFPQEISTGSKPIIEMHGNNHYISPNIGILSGNWNFAGANIMAGSLYIPWKQVTALRKGDTYPYAEFCLMVSFGGIFIITPTYMAARNADFYISAGDPKATGIYSMHVHVDLSGDVTIDNIYRVQPGSDAKVNFDLTSFTIYAR